jgi:hypothetical protein
MKRLSLIALSFAMPLAVVASPVFSDTFGSGSTIQGAPTAPTANSAAYQNWFQATGQAAASIAPGALTFSTRSTSSAFGEVQAQFASTPITLATIGDSITLTLVFTDTGNVLLAGANTSSQIAIGLFNSGGSLPLTGAQLDAGSAATGGAAGYLGYIGRIFMNGNSSYLTRPAQSGGANSSDQDLIFNNASNGAAFGAPTGAAIGATIGTAFTGLNAGNQYGIVYTLSLTGVGTLGINEAMYNYAGGIQGSQLFTTSVTASGATLVTQTIDALAFGYRRSAAQNSGNLTINSILVNDVIQSVPEPAAFALSGAGLLGCLMLRRWKRNS